MSELDTRCTICGVSLEVRPFPDSLGYSAGYHVVVGGQAYYGIVCWRCYGTCDWGHAVEQAIQHGGTQLTLMAVEAGQ